MYFSKKKMEPVEEHEVAVWICSQKDCQCWMRENFSLEESPNCPICSAKMELSTKMLPTLHNH